MAPGFTLPIPSPGDTYLHATLERIEQIANEDVEMKGPPLEENKILVIDTNILLHEFEVLQQFVSEVENFSLPVTVVIPGIVILELDGQKNRDGLAWFSRRASAWLLKKVKERKSVKGQTHEETCKPSKNWKVREPHEYGSDQANDYLILDCASYYQRAYLPVFLCSADRNLCFMSEAANISTISPSNYWSSRELAASIFGNQVDLTKFGLFRPSYRDRKTSRVLVVDEDDKMDIDIDSAPPIDLLPSHPLDLLHLQIIEHFTTLLVDLVGRVAGPEVLRKPVGDGLSASRYAPEWAKKPYLDWPAPYCIQYLDTKKRMKPSFPRLDLFLTYPYARPGTGARRGQEWSRKDWEVALGALKLLGDTWQEISIAESLAVLQPHVIAVFEEPMRPTGIGNMFG